MNELTPEQQELKDKAIAKWVGVSNGNQDCGTFDCAFCIKYHNVYYCSDECLIKMKTECHACGGTPYKAWDIHQEEHQRVNGDRRKFIRTVDGEQCPECVRLCDEMIEFLEEL